MIKEEVSNRLDAKYLKICQDNNLPIGIWFQAKYSSSKGSVSLVHLGFNNIYDMKWEIYCLQGELFEDIERFENLLEAVKRIEELLSDE